MFNGVERDELAQHLRTSLPQEWRCGNSEQIIKGDEMAANIQIMCIGKLPRQNPFEQLRSVGGVSLNGTSWMLTQPQAIADIEAGKSNFFVDVSRRRLRVVVAFTPSGNKYLKTEHDEGLVNTLLSLPEHPAKFSEDFGSCMRTIPKRDRIV
jgi:hypothetical protein